MLFYIICIMTTILKETALNSCISSYDHTDTLHIFLNKIGRKQLYFKNLHVCVIYRTVKLQFYTIKYIWNLTVMKLEKDPTVSSQNLLTIGHQQALLSLYSADFSSVSLTILTPSPCLLCLLNTVLCAMSALFTAPNI